MQTRRCVAADVTSIGKNFKCELEATLATNWHGFAVQHVSEVIVDLKIKTDF